MKLAWGAKVSPLFRLKVVAIAARLALDANHLMACMAFESGRTFRADVRNPGSSATGLIQFMRDTAIRLGTTVEELARMTPEEQLDWVERYFQPYAGRIHSLSDTYAAILWPKAIGLADETVIFPAGTREYLANKGLDVDHDGAITKAEATAHVAALLEEGMRYAADSETQEAAPIEEVDLSRVPPRVEPTLRGEPITNEGPAMADDSNSIFGMIGDVAASFIPGGPLVKALAGKLIGAFAPLVKEKITSTLGRHDVDPAIGGQVADSLVQAAMDLTKQSDPVDAVSAATKNAAIMAQLEQSALDHVKSLVPIIDKLNDYEMQARDKDEASIESAHKRNIESDTSQPFWKSQVFAMVLLVMPMIYYAVYQVLSNDADVSQETKAMVLGFLFGTAFAAIIQYFFGTSRSSGAKDAVIGALADSKRGAA